MSEATRVGEPAASADRERAAGGSCDGREPAVWSLGGGGGPGCSPSRSAGGTTAAASRPTTRRWTGTSCRSPSRVGGTVLSVKVEDNQFVEAGHRARRGRSRATTGWRCSGPRRTTPTRRRRSLAAQAGVPITVDDDGKPGEFGGRQRRAGAGGRGGGHARRGGGARAAGVRAGAAPRSDRRTPTRTSRDLERMKQLVAKDEVSQQQYDAAVAAAEAANATVESAQAARSARPRRRCRSPRAGACRRRAR